MRQLKVKIQQGQKIKEQINEDISVKYLLENYSELEIIDNVKQGDKIAVDALAMANMRYIVKIANQFQNQGLTLEDLVNDGYIGLIQAAKNFKDTYGINFTTYSEDWISNTIKKGIDEVTNS